MKLTRRGLLKGLMGLPLVAAFGSSVVETHRHEFTADPTFLGYSCPCGERFDRHMRVYSFRWDDAAQRPVGTVEAD